MIKLIVKKIVENIKNANKEDLIAFFTAIGGFALAWLCKSQIKKKLKSLFKKVAMNGESFSDFMEGVC